jgi:hypothetical protein
LRIANRKIALIFRQGSHIKKRIQQTGKKMLRKIALILTAVLVVSCYAIPYLWLGQVSTWQGSFLFWCLAGVGVIILNFLAMIGIEEAEL